MGKWIESDCTDDIFDDGSNKDYVDQQSRTESELIREPLRNLSIFGKVA